MEAQQIPLFELSLTISQKNGIPAIEIRKLTTNQDIIKTLVLAALNNVPVIVQPSFRDKFRSIAALQEKGVLYREAGEFFFTY